MRFKALIFGSRLIAVLLSLPIIAIAGSILLPSGDVWAHLLETTLGVYATESLLLSGGVVLCTAVIGGVSAVLCSLYQFPGKKWLEWAMVLPFAFPVYIVAYAYDDMFSYGGWAYEIAQDSLGLIPTVRSMGGAILIFSLSLYPYVYLLVRATLKQQSEYLLEVSQVLGLSRLQSIMRCIIPIIRPAVIASCILVLMETLSDYAAVQHLGVNTFSVGVFRTWYGLGSLGGAAQMSLMLLCLTIALVTIEKQARKRLRYYNASGKDTSFQTQALCGWKAVLASLWCGMPIVLGFVLPAIQLVVWLSLSQEFKDYSYYLDLVGNTLLLGVGSALLVVVIAVALAYSDYLKHYGDTHWLNRIATMGYGVPSIIIAIGVMLVAMFVESSGILISGGLLLLYFAYVVRFMTPGFNAVESSLLKISPDINYTAMTLNVTGLRKFIKLHNPLIKPGIIAALILVFVDVVKEVPAALVLRPFDFTTLAIHTYELAESENLSALGMPALALVVVGVLPLFILWKRMDLSYKPVSKR